MDSYGTAVPANGYLGTSTTGEVSVIDTADPSAAVGSIAVGLHPTAMYVSGNALFVANTNSDTVSVIDTTAGQGRADDRDQAVAGVLGRVPARQHRPDHRTVTCWSPWGGLTPSRSTSYDGTPEDPVSYIGLLPTDYYPSTIATVGDQIVVTNTRGIDARGPAITTYKGEGTDPVTGHDTHSTTASLTRFTLPSDRDIAQLHRRRSSSRTAGPGNNVQEADGTARRSRSRSRRASVTRPRSSTSS